MGNIRVSEKHGVNPALGRCLWCGGDDGTLLLLGRLPGDKEAPRHVIHSYDECKACAEKFAEGLLIIEARCERTGSHNPRRQPKIGTVADMPPLSRQPEGDMYPTGRHVVLGEPGIEKLRSMVIGIEVPGPGGRMLMDLEVYGQLFPDEATDESKTG